MTREEAIKRLREYAPYSYGIWHNGEEDEKAFDMAIDALSADITDTEICQRCQETTERILNRQGDRIKKLEESVDAVQVVRCKDCKYYGTTDCQIQESFYGIKDFDYCSYGERKGGEESEVKE